MLWCRCLRDSEMKIQTSELIPPYGRCHLISQFDKCRTLALNLTTTLNDNSTLALEAMMFFQFGLIINDVFHVLNV